jgi:DNA/RNA-binding domain of Phe-tRNA-synthetase-like protein
VAVRADPCLIVLETELALLVAPGVLVADDVVVQDANAGLDAAIRSATADFVLSEAASSAQPMVRQMYRRLGLDPTKTRPSSEALLRRLRKGDQLPHVNTVVDIINWCSVETQLPFGLYDRDSIRGPIRLRRGREGEAYAGIRKDTVHVGGRLVLADDDGPFGNPTSDSSRTAVTTATRRVLVVIFAPAAVPQGLRDAALDMTAARIATYGRP